VLVPLGAMARITDIPYRLFAKMHIVTTAFFCELFVNFMELKADAGQPRLIAWVAVGPAANGAPSVVIALLRRFGLRTRATRTLAQRPSFRNWECRRTA